ncbi:TIGR04104 family putative zinc finger protein [Indiicoccus explosivorum]|uniref:TIGR04104 family putative zinc finger protein n=1 Tax=Indiicoccus explosivorum TaxID=1917864 RepID=UPI000B443BCC|nr:TIGR04104 family putative zinc finger protein [Indiicoccus explosivorum]
MPKCTNCHHRWTWKETLKSSFTLDTGMECPYCGSKQYLTRKSRKRITGFGLIGLLPLVLTAFFDFSLGTLVGLFFLILITLLIFVPRLTVLTGGEEGALY